MYTMYIYILICILFYFLYVCSSIQEYFALQFLNCYLHKLINVHDHKKFKLFLIKVNYSDTNLFPINNYMS